MSIERKLNLLMNTGLKELHKKFTAALARSSEELTLKQALDFDYLVISAMACFPKHGKKVSAKTRARLLLCQAGNLLTDEQYSMLPFLSHEGFLNALEFWNLTEKEATSPRGLCKAMSDLVFELNRPDGSFSVHQFALKLSESKA